ncbi:MAG: peptidoglycan-associated lipoprotein Pal [Syntrophales bacterium]|nr:peptidoglycan-associated lipoprotein Pal [Syntrophales bacterium]MDD5232721.1 peptidoglycan-associated lipoprotein Pal [Syntrophales bacterium]MDD5531571.1 peptidoglycan-associated lipoprotein Pal [Syntrophales bacterium]HPL63182.1 peptidoglycan-associated lipoprotein Pal [Syntrophales bacterium]
MRKRSLLFIFFALILSFSLAFSVGCAKKAAVKEGEEKQLSPEKKAEAEQAAKEQAVKEAEKKDAEAAAAIAGFDYIYFDFDKYNVKPEARETLKKLANYLNANPAAGVRVEGNADERGTAEYNLALGERRAQSAAKYLMGLGIAKKRISTISYGEERPVDPGHTEEAWAKNRNAHFVLTGK